MAWRVEGFSSDPFTTQRSDLKAYLLAGGIVKLSLSRQTWFLALMTESPPDFNFWVSLVTLQSNRLFGFRPTRLLYDGCWTYTGRHQTYFALRVPFPLVKRNITPQKSLPTHRLTQLYTDIWSFFGVCGSSGALSGVGDWPIELGSGQAGDALPTGLVALWQWVNYSVNRFFIWRKRKG